MQEATIGQKQTPKAPEAPGTGIQNLVTETDLKLEIGEWVVASIQKNKIIQLISSQIQTFHAESDELKKRVAAVDIVKESNKAYQTKNTALSDALAALRKEDAVIKGDNKSYLSRIEVLDKEIVKKDADISNKTSEISRQSVSLNEQSVKIKEQSKEIASQKAIIEGQLKQIDNQVEEIEKQVAMINNHDAEINKLNDKVKACNKTKKSKRGK